MATAQELVVDVSRIKKAINSGIPLTITSYTLPHEIEVYIEEVLETFLKELGQAQLKDYLSYCLRELAVNAKKANTKRVYFMERGLDLNNPEDYKLGMTNFKQETMENIGHYLQLQKEKGLYIKVILHVKSQIINLEVRNNVAITKTELIRIHDKLARSRQYNSLEEALTQVLDDSEGAGLGLVILVLMLKKIGLDEDCFDIVASDTETIARISIPLDQTRVENLSILSQAIVDQVTSLPQFPDNIVMIQKLINDPKSEMADIARQISMDPAMTADLLKIVNSAQFMLSKKVDSISEAVKMVGIRGIKNLLYSYGTQKILGDDTTDKRILWDHSYKTAFYAYNLAKNFRKDRNLLDDVYVGGILHDMGKIIFANVHPDLLNKIKAFCSEKGIPASTFEDLSAGLNHAEIGALIAEKWNFPDNLVSAIRLHHDPNVAPTEFKDLVETVYLANMLCEYEGGTITFDQIDKKPLTSFGITNENQLEALLDKFAAGFKRENQRVRS
ncbi:HDOD domain-containing protein [Gracilinema caldarium]|uniref:Metal dependent phosphohydrolase n=1 Tax=Gracilinema caldarium (strain ATCC 51460 / DSM 7334 / H1) TaxID=744872 RepID=F8EWM5_GRAC1|nr:HDOD domain-containing protein [Gracilinema caldarium]AEJ18188.1 metal dependent phosphohydrolase [Gracilinema caldarium DSM 7334]